MSPTVFAGLVASAILLGTFALIAVIFVALSSRAERRMHRRLVGAQQQGTVDDLSDDGRPMLQDIARRGRAIDLLVDPKGESQRLLVQAGWRSTQSRIGYYVFQALIPILMVGLVFAGIVFGHGKLLRPPAIFAVIGIAAAVALLLPRYALRVFANARRKRIGKEVPLFVHLLVLMFDAGLSTRQALSSMVKEANDVLPNLQKEIELVNRQLDAGGEIAVLLRNLDEVMEIGDLGTILGVLRQVDRYGGEIREPLLDALKVIEERRGMDMREKVNIMSGRMTAVMVLFFFPALLILVAGPAVIAISKALASQ